VHFEGTEVRIARVLSMTIIVLAALHLWWFRLR
jgi:hypothetical protein